MFDIIHDGDYFVEAGRAATTISYPKRNFVTVLQAVYRVINLGDDEEIILKGPFYGFLIFE